MKQENIKHIATEIKALITKDTSVAINQFVEFAEMYAKSEDLADKAVILKLSYIFSNTESDKRLIINEVKNLLDEIVINNTKQLHNDELQKKHENENAKINYYNQQPVPNDLIVSCNNISKIYKGKFGFKLNNVDLNLRLGEITAIFGENASGKTTLIKQIIGEVSPDKGKITFPYFNQGVVGKINWMYIKQRIAYVPQQLENWYGNLKDNLHYEATLHNIIGKYNEREVEYIGHRLGLDRYWDRSWDQLSGGYKLRFALARALVWRPSLLILDEPLANLDPKAQLILLNDLKAFSRSLKNPVSILITSQTLDVTEFVADKIMFIKGGNNIEGSRILYYGAKEDFEHDRVYNKFTISGQFKQSDLESILSNLNPIEIYYTGFEYVVVMPINITSNDILQSLLNSAIEVKDFSNISQSVKSMFV